MLLFANSPLYVATKYRNGVVMFPTPTAPAAAPTAGLRVGARRADAPVVAYSQLTVIMLFHNGTTVDFPPVLEGPWSVAANTCANVPAGATRCKVTIRFAPTAPGSYRSDFQMKFENAAGGPVPTQDLTLIGSA